MVDPCACDNCGTLYLPTSCNECVSCETCNMYYCLECDMDIVLELCDDELDKDNLESDFDIGYKDVDVYGYEYFKIWLKNKLYSKDDEIFKQIKKIAPNIGDFDNYVLGGREVSECSYCTKNPEYRRFTYKEIAKYLLEKNNTTEKKIIKEMRHQLSHHVKNAYG